MKLANFTREHADVLAGGPAIAASSAVSTHASGTASMHVASAVTIADAGNYYSSGTVEGALQELGAATADMLVYDEGILAGTATSLNFVGTGVSSTVTGGTAVVTVSSAGSSLVVYDEGVLQGTPTALDFIGSGVSAAMSSGTAQITITSGSAYSNIPIYDEGSLMGTATTGLNFTGSGVSGTVTGGTAVITIGAFVGAKAYHSTTQSITTAVLTAADLNSEEFDTDGFHGGSPTSRMTIPTGLAGKYLVTGGTRFTATNTTGYRLIGIGVDGSRVRSQVQDAAPSATSDSDLQVTAIVDLVAGNYVELLVYQTSGGSLDIGHASAAEVQTNLALTRLGT